MDMSAWNRIFEGPDRVEAHIERAGKGQAVIFSARSPDKDTGNEDAAAIFEVGAEQVVIAVADGLGGLPGGDKASALALRALRDTLATAKEQATPVREAILAGFDRANQKVTALGNGSATTLVVVEIDGHTVRSYHVGDSGVIAFGGRGKIKMETIAHSPVGYAIEAGVLTPHEAIEHEDRHIVSNVVGDPGMHLGMSSPIRLNPRDTVVLASDGLFDNLHAHEIVEFLRRGPLLKGVQAITAECNERMTNPKEGRPSKPDDCTLIAYRRGAA